MQRVRLIEETIPLDALKCPYIDIVENSYVWYIAVDIFAALCGTLRIKIVANYVRRKEVMSKLM